jgi:hypothetical protein
VSSLAGAANDSPRSSTTDVNISGQFIIGKISCKEKHNDRIFDF